MVKRAKFIEENQEVIRKMVKNGDISTKLLAEYRMYQAFITYKGPKMMRYTYVAEDFKCCVRTVMLAVKKMEKTLR